MTRDPALKNIIYMGTALAAVILAGVIVSGYYYVWYRSTGFREQNLPTVKPQETAYPAAPAGAISSAGKEPVLTAALQASTLKNPLPPTADSLKEGEELYLTFCEPCHGRTGDGEGIMGSVPALALLSKQREIVLGHYLSGYMAVVPKIDVNFVQHQSDGEIFYTITNGGEAIMPAFRDALSPEQRWHLINFIKIRLGEAGGQ